MKCNLVRTAATMFAIWAAMAIAAYSQTLTTLASFNQFDGSTPSSALIQGVNGNLLSTTASGGAFSGGTIFGVSSSGTVTTLYSFCAQAGCTDGLTPEANLTLDVQGNLYGTTSDGGANGHYGTIFRVTASGKQTTIYSFCALTKCADGGYPQGTVLRAPDGKFFGTAFSGGVGDAQYCNGGCGTFFKVTATGAYTVLHSFAGYNTEGADPSGDLVLNSKDGNFYGTTANGGASNTCALGCGTVFKVTPTGVLTTLYNFCAHTGCTDGAAPSAGLILARDGNFYGTTASGGTSGTGTVFKITPTGALTTLYSFCSQTNCTDGQEPRGGLLQATDGSIYGTTMTGGAYNAGSVFRMTSAGKLNTIYSFCSGGYPKCPDGSLPTAGLFQATNGLLYGSTSSGGNSSCDFGYGCGTIFSLNMGLGPFVSFIHNPAKAGQQFAILGNGLKGTTAVSLNGTAVTFTVKSDTYIVATVPAGATSGSVVVTTAKGTLKSNVPFTVIP